MSSQAYLSEEENLAELVSQMDFDEKEIYESFGHLRVDPGFLSRIYVIYRPTGLARDGKHNPPEILGQVKVIYWRVDVKLGTQITFEDMKTGEVMQVTHVPVRLFNYDVFVSAPPYQRLRFEGRRVGKSVQRSMSFSILFKTKVRSNFYSKGVTFCETPKCLRDLYPDMDIPIQYI